MKRLWWRSGALLLAFAIAASYVVSASPVVADQAPAAHASLKYSFDDFANAARLP